MKRSLSYAIAAVIMTALIGFFAATIFWRPETNRSATEKTGQVSAATSVAPDSPLPSAEPFPPPPALTELPWIVGEPFTGAESIELSQMTPLPLTPEPWIPPTPYPEDRVVTDPIGTFTLMIPKGWYAFFATNSVQGAAEVANFDLGAMEGRPKGGISIHFSIEQLKEGQTFEQWLVQSSEYIESPTYGPSPISVTENQPITFNGYSGVTFDAEVFMDDGQVQTLESIFLLTNEKWVTGIVIKPKSAPDYPKALSILETLIITPQ